MSRATLWSGKIISKEKELHWHNLEVTEKTYNQMSYVKSKVVAVKCANSLC